MKCTSPEFIKLSKDILVRGDSLRFQARGWSMFPAVRNGDILNVYPSGAGEIRPQDIIFCHNEDERAIAHRVIKKILSKNGIALMIKGDSYRDEGEIIPLENVLGKVRDIERNGRKFNICQGWGRLEDRFYLFISPLIKITEEAVVGLLNLVQSLKFYHSLAGRLIRINVVYQREPLEDYTGRIFAKSNDTLIGETTINKFPDNEDSYLGWWIFGTWVKWRYRRMGIGRQLTKIACDVATGNGATEVKLLVFEDNKAALNLYKKAGFYQISIPRIDAELKDEAMKTGRRRVIMKKDLQL